jgi:hypothetical protein
MKEASVTAKALRTFFKVWIDIVRDCTKEHPNLYPSAVEAELRALGYTVHPNPDKQGFPTEGALTAEEMVSRRAAEATVRKYVAAVVLRSWGLL